MTVRVVSVGVDIGTTETKALVLDTEDGRRPGFARQATTWSRLPGGRVETTAEALFDGALAAVSAALREATARTGDRLQVSGIGLAGLAESGVALDPHGRIHGPVIAWFDQRGADELAALDPEFRAAFPGRVGLPVDAQCTLAKLLWSRAQGAGFEPGTQWLNIPEYVAHRLGGDRVTEPSLASRTGLLDLTTGLGWDAALELAGVGAGFLPEPRPAGTSAGRVDLSDVPQALRGAHITVVGHDHPVAAIGAGAIAPDQLFNSTGTADVLLRSVPRPLTPAERAELVAAGYSAGLHVLPGFSVLIGSVRAGLVLRRVLGLLGRDDPAGTERLDRAWRPDAHLAAGVRVTGARPTDTEVTIHLHDGASPDAAWAAALAHVNAETAASLHAVERIVGRHTDAVAAGGWVRLASVRAAKCAVIPGLRFADVDQPGAFGAALFAAWAGAGNPGGFHDFSTRLRPRPSVGRHVAQPEEAITP
jgi:sugar (pentulose or hexulose) kinase